MMMKKNSFQNNALANSLARVMLRWLIRMMLLVLVGTGQLAHAGANFFSLTASPSNAVAAPGATVPVTFSGTVNSSITGDAIQTISVVEGSTTLAGAGYAITFKTGGEIPNNTTQVINLTANLGVGVHQIHLHAETYNTSATNNDSAIITVTVAGQVSNAAFVSQSGIPSTMTVGQSYPVTITMKNTGTTTWDSSPGKPYRLGTQNPQDNSIWGLNRVSLPNTVAPGATVSFNFNITAPTTPGSYNVQWQMVQDTIAWFGGATTNIPVTVQGGVPVPTFSSPANGSRIVASGSTGNATITGSTTVASDTSISSLSVYDGATQLATSSTTSISTTKALSIGTHTLELRAIDRRGKTASVYSTVYVAAAPIVTLTTPAAGARYVIASGPQYSVPIVGTVTPSGTMTISKVELLKSGSSLGTISFSGANVNTTFALNPGTYSLQLRATDSGGVTGTSAGVSMTVVGGPPIPVLTAPVSGTRLLAASAGGTATTTVTGSATVSTDTTISNLNLYDNGTLIGSSSTAILSVSHAFPVGTHSLTLTATDVKGARATATSTLVVAAPATATLSSPTSGTSYQIPSGTTYAVPIAGSVTPSSNMTITKIELLDGGIATTLPLTSGSVNTTVPLAAATHSLSLRVTDSGGATVTSGAVSITVLAATNPPRPTLSAPVSGTRLVTTGTSATTAVTGSATATVGTISKLELYDGGGAPIATSSGATMSSSLTFSLGTHTLELRATDSRGVTGSVFSTLVVTGPTSVALSAPLSGSSYPIIAGTTASITVAGTVTPANGATVTKIEVLDAGVSIATIAAGSGTKSTSVPLAAGTHALQLRVTDSLSQVAMSTAATVYVYAPANGDGARFVSQTVPSSLRAGQPYTISVTMLNTGTTNWSDAGAYHLGAQNPQDNRLWTVSARASLSSGVTVAPGQSYAFQIPVTAPVTPRAYNLQWRMVQDGKGWFGDSSANAVVTVTVNTGPSASLSVTPTNVRMNGSTPVTLTFVGSGAESGHMISKLELFQGTGSVAGYGPVPIKSVSGSSGSLTLNHTANVTAADYWYKLRATDDAGTMTDSASVIVNVTNSSLLGQINGVRIDSSSKPQLVGWACQPGVSQALNYQVFLDAPTAQLGGQLLYSGTAALTTEPDNQAVQTHCATPGVGHHFNVDLSAFTTQYAGRAMYVQAAAYSGTETEVLPCADNGCTMPGTMRIALSSPGDGSQFPGPSTVFMSAKITGANAPFDEVSFGVDGTWIAGTVDTSPGATPGTYFATSASLPVRSTPYVIQSRVRQGNTTVYSANNMTMIVAGALVTMQQTSPSSGSSYKAGTAILLSTTVTGTGVQSVQFYANGAPIGNGVNNSGIWTSSWSVGLADAYSITSQAFDGSGHQLAASTGVNITVTAGSSSSATPLPVVVAVPGMGNPDAGTLPGGLNIDAQGAATYNVPIIVPPGTAGMQPELSMNYSSNGSNGMMGLGWSLGGLSTIHRCAKTIAQDGMPGRISFDLADRLCLDGQRLLRSDGANPGSDVSAIDSAYWAAGAQYRTEQESFSRITRLANGGFKVETKDGRIRYFGIDAGSAIAAQGRSDGQPLVWALARVEDRKGNAMTVSYSQDAATGEYLPSQLRYGGNASLTADLAVRFSYEARTDAQLMYMGGSRNDLRNRLTHVKTYFNTAADGTGGTLVRDYTLHYTTSANSGRSLIDWIQACAINQNGGANECMPKTSFDWGAGGSLSYREVPTTATIPVFVGSFYEKRFSGNLDGRGISVVAPNVVELCYQGTKPCDHLGSDEDKIGYKTWDGQLLINLPDGSQISRTLRFPNVVSLDLVTGIMVGDLDGDGREDLILTSTIPGQPAVAGYCLTVPANGSIDFKCTQWWGNMASTLSEGSLPSMVDMRNEHKVHLIFGTSPNAAQPNDCFYDTASGAMKCQDFTVTDVTPATSPYGNLPDQPYFQVAGIDLSKQDVSDFYSVWRNSSSTITYQGVTVCWSKRTVLCQNVYQGVRDTSQFNSAPLPVLSKLVNVGDLNGDGLTDFIYTLDNQSILCLSTENGVDCQPAKGLEGNGAFKGVAIGDFAGEGANQVEVFALVNGVVQPYQLCRLHDGQFQCQGLPVLPSDVSWGQSVTAPGLSETLAFDTGVYANPSNRIVKQFLLEGAAASDKLVGVTNGVGQREEIDYARADDTSAYRPFAQIDGVEQRPVYPQVTSPQGVLAKQLRRGNGQGGWLSNGYFYEGAVSDAHGRGSYGFAQITNTDLQTNISTVTTLNQNFPYVGMITRSRTYSGRVLLADTQNTPGRQTLALLSGAQSVFAYTSKAVVARKDLDGSDLGTATTVNQYGDGWGNLTQQTVTATGGGQTFNSQTVTTFNNDASGWLLGLPAMVSLTKTDALGNSVTRNTAYTYDGTTGLLATETIEPNVSQFQLVTTYDRSGNVFGLVNKKLQTWFDPATQTPVTRTLSDARYDAKGRFISTVANALGHSETHSYDPGTGVRLSLTDPNDLTTSWQVDGFGRVKKEVRPDGNETDMYTKQCQGDCPAGATVVRILDYVNGSARTSEPQLTYSDSAGHVLRTMTWGFDGRQIVTDKRYDERGRLYEADQPRFVSDAAYLASRRYYDDLNRVTKTVTSDEAGADLVTTVVYQGLIKTNTNPLNQVRTDTLDALGRVSNITDANNKSTRFSYEPFGNLNKTIDPNGNVVVVSYDKWGHRTDLNDPDLGWIHYDVDPLGQVWAQTSANQRAAGKRTTFSFDLLGRMLTRSEPDLESRWKYDTGTKAKGKLVEAYTLNGAFPDYDRTQTYDALGRPSVTSVILRDSKTYTSLVGYDAWGRVVSQTYQRGSDAAKVYDLRYNDKGYLARLERSGLALWSASSEDAALRQTTSVLGNGLTQTRQYYPHEGYLHSAALTFATGGAAQLQESYQYDALGSVTNRTEYWGANASQVGFAEDFTYDNLNRLSTSWIAGQAKQSFYYDALGNLTGKTNVGSGVEGSYGYVGGNGGPHALKSIAGIAGSFSYDLNGNQLAAPGRAASWTNFDMPLQLAKGSVTSNFVYGPEHQRALQLRSDGSSVNYAGGQESETKGNVPTVRTYWPMGIGFEVDNQGTTQMYWVHHDRIGSVVATTDAYGNLVESTAYDAWGKRRNLTANATPEGVIDNKGFTGHEMLDQLDLVHMNGRVYDPLTAKFLSGDPLVQDPVNGQNYNRYSYVLNNPTNVTDPTGFASEEVKVKKDEYASESILKGFGRAFFAYVNPESTTATLLSASNRTEVVAGAKGGSANSVVKAGVDGTRNFIDGGYGEKINQAIANGEYGNAAAYTVAGAMFGAINVVSFGEAGAIANTAKAVGTELVAGQGGRFAELVGVVGDDLTAHHMPQAALKFTSKADGGAVVMTTAEHAETRTFAFKGALTKTQDAALSFRDVLAKDIRDLRSIVGSRYNEGVKDMIKYYKENFPELMKKKD